MSLSTEAFWCKVIENFESRYGNIARYALSLLVLPFSNAIVERIFSMAGAIRTKSKNRLLIAGLDAILRVRINIVKEKKCCNDFEVDLE